MTSHECGPSAAGKRAVVGKCTPSAAVLISALGPMTALNLCLFESNRQSCAITNPVTGSMLYVAVQIMIVETFIFSISI